MLKRVIIFTIIAAVLAVGVWRLGTARPAEVQVSDNVNKVEEGTLEDDKSYVLSTSPHGDKKIVCTGDNELVLHVKNGNMETSKSIYKGYKPLSEDPYSMYNLEKYNVQWSENERYVFVRDIIYDIETDRLVEIKNNIAFMWAGNKGLFMEDGYYYKMELDNDYSNYMAIAKKINVFEDGNIRTLACTEDGKYFVCDNIHMDNMFDVTDDYLEIDTASLKYKAENLQQVIDKEYSKMVQAIYRDEKINRLTYPEEAIANGKYYLKNISYIQLPINADKSYVLSTSPSGDKKIACTIDNELVLHVKKGNNETSKSIYKGYKPLSEDPYSMYNFEDYNIQWSQNERYVFVRDSIYDIETDKLTEIKSNVAFRWAGNKGFYMDNGYYYTMGFTDSYTNYMAISKEIEVFEDGNIRTLARAEDSKYFVWDNIHMENMFDVTDDYLGINTASLKYKAENLQQIIDKEYRKMINAIYEEKKIDRLTYPEQLIANGKYYLKNIKYVKIPIEGEQ